MESTEKKSITLMLTVDDFRALCNMVHVIRENGMRLINGGARVSFDIDKCGINEESIANLKNLKKSEKTGRLQIKKTPNPPRQKPSISTLKNGN